jgi:hypothetical protein
MIMEWTVNEMMQDRSHPGYIKQVTEAEYLQWARGFVFDGLRDQRYGQSFCNHFDIHDNILFYCRTVEEADRYIQKVYIR